MSATLTPSVLNQKPEPDAAAPAWLSEARADAWSKFDSLPMPEPKDEPWRFASIRKMALEGFGVAAPAELGRDATDGAFTFVNNHSVATPEIDPELAAKGVVIATIAQATAEHGEILRRFLHAQSAPLGSEKFRALHTASQITGVFVFVPAGVVIDKPIIIEHHVGEGTIFPHTLVVAEANSQVTVIDRLASLDNAANGLAVGVFDLYAADGAAINYLRTQNLSLGSRSFAIGTTLAEKDSDVKSVLLNLGAGWSRNEHVSHMNGTGSNSDMLSITVPTGEQEVDQRTFQHHHAQHTTSDLLFKNALYDQAKSVFGGLILVDEGAHHTDSYQTCRNLLLSDKAEAHSMPGLEINADQVKCSHGSTSGQIGDEQIFYLMARGIHEETSRRLIALGFTLEVLEKISDKAILEEATAMVEAKFAAIG